MTKNLLQNSLIILKRIVLVLLAAACMAPAWTAKAVAPPSSSSPGTPAGYRTGAPAAFGARALSGLAAQEPQSADLPNDLYLPVLFKPALPVHFSTRPPGSALPSDAECAAVVKPRPENKHMNKTYNATRGSQKVGDIFAGGAGTSIYNSRITGNYTGTTDEILQWVACKWGIEEDIVRAQAAKESWWEQTVKGDWTTDSSRCAPGHGLGVDGKAGQCPESFGILQNRYPYEQDSWPGIYTSTAWNADVAYAYWRACYEGYTTWLGGSYVKGDAWGCVGRWFSGAWHDYWSEQYISAVKDYLRQRVWESPNFQEP